MWRFGSSVDLKRAHNPAVAESNPSHRERAATERAYGGATGAASSAGNKITHLNYVSSNVSRWGHLKFRSIHASELCALPSADAAHANTIDDSQEPELDRQLVDGILLAAQSPPCEVRANSAGLISDAVSAHSHYFIFQSGPRIRRVLIGEGNPV